ncbi:MAG TPA: cupredoxin family copper-binding protein [Caldimonas sp.]|jgi:plastocyanin|nr:cupredoxin family copper-binding protein [Caldimonas sp.]
MKSIKPEPRDVVRARRRLAMLSLAVAAIATWPDSFAAGPAIKTVDIAKFAFVPKEITIAPGTRVRWTNHDETPHTVTSQSAKKVLSSPGLDVDDHYEFVFNDEGDYAYLCTIHPMMTGVVHVRRPGGKTP